MIDRLNARNLIMLRIENMKKWLSPPSSADYKVDYKVVHIPNTLP